MWLEQKKYSFQCEKSENIQEDFLDKIFLKVNDNLTTVKLTDLFIKMSDEFEFDESSNILEIEGYSILEKVENGILKTENENGEIKISFYSEEFGEISVLKIKNPWFQANDKKISEEDYQKFISKIIELSQVEKQEDKQAGAEVEPHTKVPVVNENYERAKTKYINNGFKEFIFDDFRLLISKNSEKTKAILVEILDENSVNQLTKFSQISDNNYQFEDVSNNKIFDVKIENDKFNIEIVEQKPV